MLEDIRDAIDARRWEIAAAKQPTEGELRRDQLMNLLERTYDTLDKARFFVDQTKRLAQFLKQLGIDPDIERGPGEEATIRREAALQLAPELAKERRILQQRIANLERENDRLKIAIAKYPPDLAKMKEEIQGLRRRGRKDRDQARLAWIEVDTRGREVFKLKREIRSLRSDLRRLKRSAAVSA
jgi:hypothetical protein